MAGVLSKQEIETEINQGRLIRNARIENVEACSYDLRVGTVFRDGQVLTDDHPRAHEQCIIQPGELVSMFTREELELPADVCTTAFAMNQQSSRGLLVLNAGHVDPGYSGPLTVKALNMRKVPLALSHGDKIFTIIFERLPTTTTHPYQKNLPRQDRERQFNATDIEVSPRSIAELVTNAPGAPFPTRQEVREMIRDHWASRWSLFLSFVAAIAGIIAAVQAFNIAGSTAAQHPTQLASPKPDADSKPLPTPAGSDASKSAPTTSPR